MNRETGHIIIAGFGPVGRVLADALTKRSIAYHVIELNAQTVERQRSLGVSITLGDARQSRVLEEAGIDQAAAVVITIPDAEVALECCAIARELAPTAIIAVRTRHLSDALQAKRIGADITVVEEIEAANALEDVLTTALSRLADAQASSRQGGEASASDC